MKLFPGTNINLSCDSVGIPTPILSWYKDFVYLSNGDESVTIVSIMTQSTLLVVDSRGVQGGEYNCTGSNIAGYTSVLFNIECK